jgi:hypothetical protein
LDGKYCSQAKIIADRNPPYNNTSGGFWYNDHVQYDPQGFGAYLPRHLAFMEGMMVFFQVLIYGTFGIEPNLD